MKSISYQKFLTYFPEGIQQSLKCRHIKKSLQNKLEPAQFSRYKCRRTAGGSCLDCRQKRDISQFVKPSFPALVPNSLLCNEYRKLFRGFRRPECKANLSFYLFSRLGMKSERRIYLPAIRLYVSTGSNLSLILLIFCSVVYDKSIMTEVIQLHSQHNFKPKNHHKNKWPFKNIK